MGGLIIGFTNVILKELGFGRSGGADPAVWVFRYETQKQKEIVAISITERTGRSKKNSLASAPQRREETRGSRHKSGRVCRDDEIEAVKKRGGVKLTVIFTVPSDAQAPGLDSRKT